MESNMGKTWTICRNDSRDSQKEDRGRKERIKNQEIRKKLPLLQI